jgi:hypothetical protein
MVQAASPSNQPVPAASAFAISCIQLRFSNIFFARRLDQLDLEMSVLFLFSIQVQINQQDTLGANNFEAQ